MVSKVQYAQVAQEALTFIIPAPKSFEPPRRFNLPSGEIPAADQCSIMPGESLPYAFEPAGKGFNIIVGKDKKFSTCFAHSPMPGIMETWRGFLQVAKVRNGIHKTVNYFGRFRRRAVINHYYFEKVLANGLRSERDQYPLQKYWPISRRKYH
ncbi:hypothetical protein GHYDROH2_01030 [Geobacter hydrogenophilus]|uniref:Uncharacterized protein n=1 Tax=Geobacter hydrogenophilus TaxID=40983 RepID=A0A9W6FXG6_9BACT|nr:hypothetical protein GHYDROH2_01030 [Geobacter hydrogenophilus]